MFDESNFILSISGGKDSTAMLIEMLERNIPIHAAVWFDTGWEFPEMYSHISKLEQYTGVKIWRLRPRIPFDYWLYERPIIAMKGPMKGQVYRRGNGWPAHNRRWCTRQKIDTIDLFAKPIPNAVECIGYAADEIKRTLGNEIKAKGSSVRFPLIEFGITEKKALEICYAHGFDWDGLYKIFNRVSCFCCPLGGLKDARKLRTYYPELWLRVLKMDSLIQNKCGFYKRLTAHDLEQRFRRENMQLHLLSNQIPRCIPDCQTGAVAVQR